MSLSLVQNAQVASALSAGGGGGGGVTSLVAGDGITLSPDSGVGVVTVSATSSGAGVTGLIAGGVTTTSPTPTIIGAGGITASASAEAVTLTFSGGASGVSFFAPPAGTALTPKTAGTSTETSINANVLAIPAGLTAGQSYQIKLSIVNFKITETTGGSAGQMSWTPYVATSLVAGENDLNSLFGFSQPTIASAPASTTFTANSGTDPLWNALVFFANYDALDANVYLNVNISVDGGSPTLPDTRSWTVGTYQYELVVVALGATP